MKRAATERGQGQLKREYGSFDVSKLGPDDSTSHETEKFEMSKSQLKEGWFYLNGGDKKAKDSLVGCWVRLYKDGIMLKQVSLPAAVARKYS